MAYFSANKSNNQNTVGFLNKVLETQVIYDLYLKVQE